MHFSVLKQELSSMSETKTSKSLFAIDIPTRCGSYFQ
jgi:hypothetical protein